MQSILANNYSAAAREVHRKHATTTPEGLRNIAAEIAAPILCAYVWWTLNHAKDHGIRKIWFCARDGQILKRIAEALLHRSGSDIQTGYLFAGRQVVHLPALRVIDAQALAWMTGGCGATTLPALLERVALTIQDIGKEIKELDLPQDSVLGWKNADKIQQLFRTPRVQALVLEQARRRRQVTHDYFRQCGLLDQERCAIVDVGWRGSILRSLFNLIGEENGKRHAFLYFGLYGRPADLPQASMHTFAFDHSITPHIGDCGDVPALTSLIEIFCLADHAPAMGIEDTPSGPAPRLRPGNDHEQPDWNVKQFQECVVTFAEHLQLERCNFDQQDLAGICSSLLHQLSATPTRQQANLLGKVLFHDDQAGTTAQRFAVPYSMRDLRATLRKGSLPDKTLAWWTHGAYTITPPLTRVLLRAAAQLGRIRNGSRTPH
jgi:hypothetical protein